jgi:multiple sugar transport system permease protein
MTASALVNGRSRRPAARSATSWTDGPRTDLLLLAPAFVGLLALTGLPLVGALWTSLQAWDLGTSTAPQFIGLENFRSLATDGAFWKAAGLTAYQVLGTVTVQLVVGVLMALLLSRRLRGAGLLRALYLLPMMSTPVVVGLLWKMLLNTDSGAVNQLIGVLGLGPVDWLGDPRLAMPSIIGTDVWLSTPFVVIIVTAGLQSIPGETLEAATVDGASAWQRLRFIILPMIRPMIVLAVLFRTMDAIKRFDTIYVMTGGGPGNATETLDLHAFFYSFQYLDAGKGAAVAMIMLAIIMTVSAVLLRFVRPPG